MTVRTPAFAITALATLITATLVARQDKPRENVPVSQPPEFEMELPTVAPQSSQSPFVVPTSFGWHVAALLTVGDSAGENVYQMVGIPDGLGALPGRPGLFGLHFSSREYITVYMNHELGSGAGAVRAHGKAGAFVSEWVIKLDTLEVKSGADLIRDVYLWNGTEHVLSNGAPETEFGRFCSADLAAARAFFNPWSFRGYFGRLYLNGEEVGNEGRAFAHVLTGFDKGETYQLPHLGRMSYENAVAHPDAGNRTLVVNLDDSTPGQVYLYAGTKQWTGTPVQRAGLVGGSLFGIRVTDGGANYANGPVPFESNGAINGTFQLVDLSDVAAGPGATLQTTSRTRGVTEFARPEDGQWDTRHSNVFYFVTTGASVATPPNPAQTQTARLYKLTFNSLQNPTGGRIELVVDSASLIGTDLQTARSFDNITVDESGRVLVQEDPGNTAYIAKTWRIDPRHPFNAEQILESDRARFEPGGSMFLTQDEENSGIIEITDLVTHANWFRHGRRYYLADTQVHRPLPSPLVEDGQLYLIASRRLR
jgi:hypothetical protein